MSNLDELMKALEAGGYNAKPSKLRQGCIMIIKDDGTEPTEEELDAIWARLETQKAADQQGPAASVGTE
jgi:hypothetical protein